MKNNKNAFLGDLLLIFAEKSLLFEKKMQKERG